jgi:hypothetical protein
VGSLERRLEALEEAPARYPYGRGGTPMGGAVPLWAGRYPYGRPRAPTNAYPKNNPME